MIIMCIFQDDFLNDSFANKKKALNYVIKNQTYECTIHNESINRPFPLQLSFSTYSLLVV
jgi:hypothetical protein